MRFVSIIFILFGTQCFGQFNKKLSQKENQVDTIKLTDWQLKQMELVEEEKKRLTERVNFLLQVVIDSKGIDLEKVEAISISNGNLIIRRKEQ